MFPSRTVPYRAEPCWRANVNAVLDRLRQERESNEDAQERLAFTKHDSYSWLSVLNQILFFKHSLICYCDVNCNIAHAGWLGAGSIKEVARHETIRMQ